MPRYVDLSALDQEGMFADILRKEQPNKAVLPDNKVGQEWDCVRFRIISEN